MRAPAKDGPFDQVMKTILDRFGEGAIMTLGDAGARPRSIESISTGSLNIDEALGLGRLPLGRIVDVYGPESGGKATLLVAVTDDLVERVNAGRLVRDLAPIVGGRGGGRPNLAQAGGPDVTRIDDALVRAAELVESTLTGS